MMDDDRFQGVIRDLPSSYSAPPPPPLDDMWGVIADAHFETLRAKPTSRNLFLHKPWLAAATLLVGIGIGALVPRAKSPATTQSTPAQTAVTPEISAVADAYRDQTNH